MTKRQDTPVRVIKKIKKPVPNERTHSFDPMGGKNKWIPRKKAGEK